MEQLNNKLPDTGEGRFHPSDGSHHQSRQPWWDAATDQDNQDQAAITSWPVSQVGRRERLVFLMAGPRSSGTATTTKHTLEVKASLGPSQGSTLGLCCPTLLLFPSGWLLKPPAQHRAGAALQKRENPGAGGHGRAGGRWVKLKSGEDLNSSWGKSRKNTRGSWQWMLSLLKQSRYLSHRLVSGVDQ